MPSQVMAFWLVPGGVKLKTTTSGPNPWFWAQSHGFGPDVVTFGFKSPKTHKNYQHLAQTQVLGPRTWVWARCGTFWVFWEGTHENRLSTESLTAARLHAACVARPLNICRCGCMCMYVPILRLHTQIWAA